MLGFLDIIIDIVLVFWVGLLELFNLYFVIFEVIINILDLGCCKICFLVK